MQVFLKILIVSMVFTMCAGNTYSQVSVTLQSPVDGATVRVPSGNVDIKGLAEAVGTSALDVVFVIDISKSTEDSTGTDFNGDGRPDTILDAEKFSVHQKILDLDQLNRYTGQQSARAGIVGFCHTAISPSGLTGQFQEIGAGLNKLSYDSWTNFQSGVELGLRLLDASNRPDAQKMLVFLSDGKPNKPNNEQYAREAALAAAEIARQKNVIIHTFAIGPVDVTDPIILRDMARRTGGRFNQVENPANLPEIFAETSLVNIRQVTVDVKNIATAQVLSSTPVVPEATGLFTHAVTIGVGRHEITATAEAEGGKTGSQSVIVTGVAPAATPTPVPTVTPVPTATPVPTVRPACDMEKAEMHLRQGLAYAGQKDFRNSELEFLKAIDLCETYAEAHANLGVTYIGLSALNKAERSLKRAAALDPGDPYAQYNLAVIYSLNEKMDVALEALEKALENGFNEIDALRHDPDLKNVRQDPEFRKILEKHRIFLK